MDYLQLSPAQFADVINVNRSGLTHIFNGRNQPSLDLARKILKAFPEVNTEWLIMGVGPMLSTEPQIYQEEQKEDVKPQLSSLELDLFSNYSDENTESDKSKIEKIEQSEQPPKEVRTVKQVKPSNLSELDISKESIKRKKISQSQRDKEIEKEIVKVVFFYSDMTFDTYFPNSNQ